MALTGYETGSLNLPIIAIAAGTDVTNQPLLRTRRKIRVSAVRIGTQETVTQHNTGYVSLSVNVGTTTIARHSTVTSGEGTLTGGVMTAMQNIAANLDIASAQNVVFKATHSGGGTAVATPVIQLEYAIVD